MRETHQSPRAAAIDRATSVEAATFFDKYYEPGRPVFLEGFVRDWPAVGKWSPRYFAERFGDVPVEVAGVGSSGVRPENGWATMRLGELATRMENESVASAYLMAQGHGLEQPGLRELHADIIVDKAFFGASADTSCLGLWVGPRHTVTPLHFDKTGSILAQVYGSKRLTLICPSQTPNLYNSHGGYSDVDLEQADAAKTWPLLAGVPMVTVTLAAGDAVFLPSRWWHHVRSLTASISVSLYFGGRLT